MASANQFPDNPYKQKGTTSFSESRGFLGLDLWTNPQDMDGGHLLAADNLINRQGNLYVRPGLRGMFGGNAPSSSSLSSSSSGSSLSSSSSPQYIDVGLTRYSVPGGANYGLCQFNDSLTGATWILFTSGGRIFKTLQASGSYTELLDTVGSSYAFDSPNTCAVVFGDFAYIVDGNHALVRVSLNGGYPAYSMQSPKQSPPAQLTNTQIFAANEGAANWSFDGQTTPDGNLLASQGLINGPPVPNVTWGSFPTGGASTPGDYYNIISPGSGIFASSAIGTSPNFLIAVPALSGNANLYPSRFHLLMNTIKDVAAGAASLNVYITPYNSSQQQLAGSYVQNIVPTTQQIAADLIFDMSALGPNVAYISFLVLNAVSVHGGNMYIETPQLYPITTETTFIATTPYTLAVPSISGGAVTSSFSSSSSVSSSSSLSGSSSSSSSSLAGFSVNNAPTDLGTTLDYQGTSFTYTFPVSSSSSSSSSMSHSSSSSSSGALFGGVDFSRTDRLTIGIGNGQVQSWVGLKFALYLKRNGAWILADNGVTISDDQTALDCDISTIPTSQRTNITALKLTFLLNVQWTAPFYALPLGPINTPGNLSIASGKNGLTGGDNAPYIWYVTEEAVIDASNSIESNPSLASNTLAPTFAQAEALVSLPSDSPVNSGPPADVPLNQLWYNLYRRGGAWPDARLIATVNSQTSVIYGSDPTNPYYSWNPTTRTFLDNTPDIWLDLANILSFARDPMPSNAQAEAVWQGRLFLAVGNTIYASWLSSSGSSAALMTTEVFDATDPNLSVVGAVFPISEDATDTIVAMTPFGTPVQAGNQFGGALLVFCKRSVWLIQGTGPGGLFTSATFSQRQYPYTRNVGLVAPKAYAQISPNEIMFAGPDRLHIFPPERDRPEDDPGLRIQPQLYPVAPQALQNQTAFAQAWMCFHDARMYLGVPVPGGVQNSVVYVCDFRVGGGWTRLTGPTGLSNSSSSSSSPAPGSSLSSSSSQSRNWSGFPMVGMAMTSALSLPPNNLGADYDLYYFGLDGQIYRTQGTYDQATPLSQVQAIPFYIKVHAMRPGFFYRYKQRPLYYMYARLDRIAVSMVMNGPLTMFAQAFNAGTVEPTPITGRAFISRYNLAGGGRDFEVSMPGGLIEGQLIEVSMWGSVGLFGDSDIAYCRGVRGWISGTSYEYA